MEQDLPVIVPAKGRLVRWLVKENENIDRDHSLCLFQRSLHGTGADDDYAPIEELRSEHLGVVTLLSATEGNLLPADAILLRVRVACTHAMQYHGMCTFCGQDMSVTDYRGSQTNKAHLRILHGAPYLTVSESVARDIQSSTKVRLLQEKKLSLILDLDQTLIHASIDERLRTQTDLPADVFTFQLVNPHTRVSVPYYIKLRPGLNEFLDKVQEMYELHIYTLGTREYVDAITKVIDPTGRYFGNQVLSRDECPDMQYKTPKRLFPVDDSMVVVVDDRADVWQWNPALIKVRPYDYFTGSGDINAPQWLDKKRKHSNIEDTHHRDPDEGNNNSSSDNNNNNRTEGHPIKLDEDGIICTRLLRVLQRIHHTYYSTTNPNIQTLLPRLKKSVLRGCHLVFSHVIPAHVSPHTHDMWILAEIYGATCSESVTRSTTHLITGSLDTAKVKNALMNNVYVLKPDWLYDSIDDMIKMDEADYEWDGIDEKRLEIKKHEQRESNQFNETIDDMYRDLEEFEGESQGGESDNEKGELRGEDYIEEPGELGNDLTDEYISDEGEGLEGHEGEETNGEYDDDDTEKKQKHHRHHQRKSDDGNVTMSNTPVTLEDQTKVDEWSEALEAELLKEFLE